MTNHNKVMTDVLTRLTAAYRARARYAIVQSLEPGDNPANKPVTVVQVRAAPAGPLSRWPRRVDVTLTTFASTRGAAWEPHHEALAIALTPGKVDDDLRVSSPRATLEAATIPGSGGAAWPGLTSQVTLYTREED